MQTALKFTAPILPGRRIEITSPDLPETGDVELIVVLPESTSQQKQFSNSESVVEYLRSLPDHTYTAEEWIEVEAQLQNGRESWER